MDKPFDCLVSGFPLTCSKSCWNDIQAHSRSKLERLAQINQDMHWMRTRAAAELVQSHQSQTENQLQDRHWARNWDDFLLATKTTAAAAEGSDTHVVKRLISAMNTYVMTLAHYLPYCLTHPSSSSSSLDIAILGARAEAMMPEAIWTRLAHRYPDETFSISLVGDAVPGRRKVRVDSAAAITLTHVSGLYHQVAAAIPEPKVYVLFHPGLGHPLLAERWRPTMERLVSARKPILITSFSKSDQERDLDQLQRLVSSQSRELNLSLHENPFCSLKLDLDPDDLLHPVQANQYVAIVDVKD